MTILDKHRQTVPTLRCITLEPFIMRDLVIDPATIADSFKVRAYYIVNLFLAPFYSSGSRASSSRRRLANVCLLPALCLTFFWIFPLRPPLPPSYAQEYALEKAVMTELRGPDMMEAQDGRYVR